LDLWADIPEIPHEMVEPNILVQRNAFSFGSALISEAEREKAWKRSLVMGAKVDDARTSDVMVVAGRIYPRLLSYETLLAKVAGRALRAYAKVNSYATHGPARVFDDEGYDLLRYTKGQGYTEHVDHQPGVTGVHARRVVSFIAYLNGDFTGGELSFTRHGIQLKPEPGMVVCFPSNWAYPHACLPIVRGVKYAAVSWFLHAEMPHEHPHAH
jgi:predicted 2-oxoglutarate/Fe(II)-dependent dioxygenase YbiX